MAQINDAKYAALTAAGYVGTVQDMERDMLLVSTGRLATDGDTIHDLWFILWDSKVIVPGQFNDRAMQYMASLGFLDEQYNERWLNYWENETFPPPL